MSYLIVGLCHFSYEIITPKKYNNTYICFNQKPNVVAPGLIFNANLVLDSLKNKKPLFTPRF